MVTRSHIEWTEMTWNPVTGCSKITAGCKNCYAERMAKRLNAMGVVEKSKKSVVDCKREIPEAGNLNLVKV